MVALEVSVNGKRVCTAALDGDSTVNAVVSNQSTRSTGRVSLSVFGMKTLHREGFEWKTPFVDTGDEITIRVVDVNDPDPHPDRIPPKS